jgi:O-acetyl-ADP-ribose deacetylase (regulator of RNase III)
MGRGIALQFRKAFPENFKIYEAACKRGEVLPGAILVFETERSINPRFIINFPTKRHWRDKSRMADIESGLDALIAEVKARPISSIAIPALGCGLGGLNWSEVRPRIEMTFSKVPDVQVWLFEPEEFQSDVVDKPNLSACRR